MILFFRALFRAWMTVPYIGWKATGEIRINRQFTIFEGGRVMFPMTTTTAIQLRRDWNI